MKIQTERLIINALTPEQLRLACSDLNAVLKQMGLIMGQATPGELDLRRRLYALKLEQLDKAPDAWLYIVPWQIADTRNIVVGEISCKGKPADGAVEIGYGMESRYRNRGFMKEAARAFCGYLLSTDGIKTIRANTLPENFASQSVLTACGFTHAGKSGKELIWELGIGEHA